jgi:hypothetical protein
METKNDDDGGEISAARSEEAEEAVTGKRAYLLALFVGLGTPQCSFVR